jgi:hypothetical protein
MTRTHSRITRLCYLQFKALFALGLAALGCADGRGGLTTPEVDAAAAAASAIEQFDANGDAALDGEELAICPPLSKAVASFDADKDGRLTESEIANGIVALAGPDSAYVSANCTVTFEGRPLSGATIKLRPPDFIGDSLPTAEAVADDSGHASPSIPSDQLPPQLLDTPLMYPGLYHVEITHPERQLASRYNTETALGVVINPGSREGSSARFDLTR